MTEVSEAMKRFTAAKDVRVIVLHGTDTLCETGEHLHARFPRPTCPIILTGAMRPFEMRASDALQNLTEAIFATSALPPAVYCVAHSQALKLPGVIKDRASRTFSMGGSRA